VRAEHVDGGMGDLFEVPNNGHGLPATCVRVEAQPVLARSQWRRAGDGIVAGIGPILLGLVLGQIALGVINLLLGIQPWLSAFHLANAAGMLALTVATTFRIASMPAARTPWAAAPAS